MKPASTLTLGQTGDSLTVNGEPFTKDVLDGFAGEIYNLLRERHIKGLTFSKGITPEEVGWIVEILTPQIPSQEILADELYWAKKLAEGRVERAGIVPLVFAPDHASATESHLVDQAQRWLSLGDEVLLSDAILQQLVKLLDVLEAARRPEVTIAFVDRYRKMLTGAGAVRAATALANLIEHGSALTSGRTVDRIESDLPRSLSPSVPIEVRETLVPLARHWLRRALAAKNWKVLMQELAVLKAQPEAPLRAAIREQLDGLESEGSIKPLLGAFDASPCDVTLGACLLFLGSRIVPYLAMMIPRRTAAEERNAIANVLASVEPDGWKVLLGMIDGKITREEMRNVLESLTVVAEGRAEFGTLLLSLAKRPGVMSMQEMVRYAKFADRPCARIIIEEILNVGPDAHRRLVIDMAKELRIGDLGGFVLPLVDPGSSEELLLSLCDYLKVYPVPGAIGPLERIVQTRSRLLGLYKGAPMNARTAAIAALAAIEMPDAKRAVDAAAKSDEPEIREAALAAQRSAGADRTA
jgi:hypothetical protein